MTRPPVIVKRVSQEHLHDFTELWMTAKVESGVSQEAAARGASEGRVAACLDRDDVRAYIAVIDDRTVGYAVVTLAPFSGLAEAPSVAIDQLYVTRASRKQGVARQLLHVVTVYAEKLGCEQLVGNVPAHHRDANRFFARLGFSSQVVRRVTTTAQLRRRLGGDVPRQPLDQLLQRRRSLRARVYREHAPSEAHPATSGL